MRLDAYDIKGAGFPGESAERKAQIKERNAVTSSHVDESSYQDSLGLLMSSEGAFVLIDSINRCDTMCLKICHAEK